MTYSPDRNTGVFSTEAEALQAAVHRLVDAIRPHAIYLFGSRARGDNRPDSDYDLLVLTRVDDGDAGRDHPRMRRALRGLGLDTDIVPVRLDDFDAEMNSEVSMISAAMRDALKVYDERQGYCFPETGADGA